MNQQIAFPILRSSVSAKLIYGKLSILFLLFLSSSLSEISGSLSAQTGISLAPFASGFDRLVDIGNAGDERLFVAEQDGLIHILNKRGEVNPVPFLNIDTIAIKYFQSQGLLGFTFHPNYASNGLVYLNFTNADSNTVIASFQASGTNPDVVDPSSYTEIIEIPQPFRQHNGGDLNFGPDGYLYLAMGDGGLAVGTGPGDVGNFAQSSSSLLGKILRLDVDGGSPYAIPADNPYVSVPSVPSEIWASGMRNPWRVSFDRLTGDLWIADVGHDIFEEINVQPASSTGGENYGWKCYEGTFLYDTVSPCTVSYVFPDFEYGHDPTTGGFSVTGGFVYRGSRNPELYGKYIFCDYVTGNMWTMEDNGAGGYAVVGPDALEPFIVTFSEDENGEIYAGTLDGDIFLVQQNCSATSVPYNLSSLLITGTNQVNLSWSQLPSVNGYQIQGRPLGAPGLGSFITMSTSRTLGGLTTSTTYEWRARAQCTDGTITALSPFETFTTPAPKLGASGTKAEGTAFANRGGNFTVSPNPASKSALITLTNIKGEGFYDQTSPLTSPVLFTISDLSGRIMLSPISETFDSAVAYQVELDVSSLAPGTYLISQENGPTKKIIIIR